MSAPLIHLDTDFGGDPDDACALVALLGSGAQISGITTNLDMNGERAACVAYYLELANRDIPVAAGAASSLTDLKQYRSTAEDENYWPQTIIPETPVPGGALSVLKHSISRQATIVAIGALTNLALLEVMEPGILSQTNVVIMGGWVDKPEDGYPPLGPEDDFNIQVDTAAAEIVLQKANNITLVTLPVSMKAQLTEKDILRLRASGSLGTLLATQSLRHAHDNAFSDLAHKYSLLADDLVNFQWDALALTVALDWPGATVKEMKLRPYVSYNVLHFSKSPIGKTMKVVTDIDSRFSDWWLSLVEQADLKTLNQSAGA